MTKKELKEFKKAMRKYKREKKRREKRKKRKNGVNPVLGFAARLVMTVRNVSGTYNQTDGTLLPGYNQESRILGLNPAMSGDMAGFAFGRQSYSVTGRETGYNFAQVAANNNWIVQNSALNRYHTLTHQQTINGRATLEPLKDVSIDLTVNRVFGQNTQDFYRWNDDLGAYQSQSRTSSSTLTYSTISLGTAFIHPGKDYSSSVFDKLRENRVQASQVVGRHNGNSTQLASGYYDGYGSGQQDVVIGAFLATYTNSKVNDRTSNPFKAMPLPNWTINYNGLTKYDFAKKYVKNFVIRHAYTSSVSLSGAQSNLSAATDENGNVTARDVNNNFYASTTIMTVTITERFSPLIGFDATWNVKGQGLITKFELKKDRSAALSLASNQVTEVMGTEYVIGTGYKFNKVRLPIKMKGKKVESPANFRIDFSFRDNLTVIRDIDRNTNQATAGQRVVSLKSSFDYNMSQNLTIQLYYDQVITTPKIATTYKTGNLSTGIRIRFNLGGL